LLIRRAEFLGMAVVEVLPTANGSPSPMPTGAEGDQGGRPKGVSKSEPVAASPSSGVLRVRPLTIAALLTRAALDSTDPVPVVHDAVGGEPWPSRVARRALARGVTGHSRCVVCGWSASPNGSTPAGGGPPIAAAMWLDALDGVSLAVADGWRDLRDGSASASPSVFTEPEEIETGARTSLDILRNGEAIHSIEAGGDQSGSRLGPVAIVVSPNAVDPLDADNWADWIEPFFVALVERQIPFDIVSEVADRGGLARRYSLVFSLQRGDIADLDLQTVRFERELATVGSLALRRTVRELDGSFPRDLFVRSADSGEGRETIAVVNLSASPRELRITGGGTLPRLRDVLADGLLCGRDGSFTIGPWQTRLFTAR